MSSFTKLLVANRGEIACRVFRSARPLGLCTVAVFSDADADALHVAMADEAVHLGPPAATESYLKIDAILDAAKRSGADAIHPGYGFLSENAEFAAACAAAGLVFVGPSADSIQRIGNKAQAKRLALEVGVRCALGYQGEKQDDATLASEARRIGFPILIKAAAGGGGRGMRRVDAEKDLPAALSGARLEAKNAFGSDELILEEFVENARHVEIQVLADKYGTCLTLGERDCSVQRRHQKIIEESPCPVMTDELRRSMSDAARKVALASGYVNAGTVEFLLDAKSTFYFLEMNTRLQVEHPVTEMVTGLDLVELQLRVARGEALPLTQEDVRLTGHAIEARLYAEDPAAGFIPQTGKVKRWKPSTLPGIRVDHGFRNSAEITPYYDPMIAKVIAHGTSRAEARQRLIHALRETVFFGPTVNLDFLTRVLEHPDFAAGNVTTSFLERAGDLAKLDELPTLRTIAIACVVLIEDAARNISPVEKGWRSTGPANIPLRLQVDDKDLLLSVRLSRSNYAVTSAGGSISIDVVELTADRLSFQVAGQRGHADYHLEGDEVFLHIDGKTLRFRDVTYLPPADGQAFQGGAVKSPMSGQVVSIAVEAGATVKKGDLLAIVEAMKMENHVAAPRDGVVESVHVTAGIQVNANQLLITLAEVRESSADPKVKQVT